MVTNNNLLTLQRCHWPNILWKCCIKLTSWRSIWVEMLIHFHVANWAVAQIPEPGGWNKRSGRSGWPSFLEGKGTSGSLATRQGPQSVKDAICSLSRLPLHGEVKPELGEWQAFCNSLLCFLSPTRKTQELTGEWDREWRTNYFPGLFSKFPRPQHSSSIYPSRTLSYFIACPIFKI